MPPSENEEKKRSVATVDCWRDSVKSNVIDLITRGYRSGSYVMNCTENFITVGQWGRR